MSYMKPFNRISNPISTIAVIGNDTRDFPFDLIPDPLKLVHPEIADLIICYGGDGTLIGADQNFPKTPKMPWRRNSEYIKCEKHENVWSLTKLLVQECTVTLLPRLKAKTSNGLYCAINDISIKNSNPMSAVRYKIFIDGDQYSDEIVGDGLVVATPFGSSAYYRSITNSVIRCGIGVAFNNSIEAVNHFVLSEKQKIKVLITRGPAILTHDNSTNHPKLEKGDMIEIRLDQDDQTEIWGLDALICRECKERQTRRPAGWRHV